MKIITALATNPANTLRCFTVQSNLQTSQLPIPSNAPSTLTVYVPNPPATKPSTPNPQIRHILLGDPATIRQTIHLLHTHTLRYAEPVLWTPIVTITDSLTLTPSQGESMSLLRRSL